MAMNAKPFSVLVAEKKSHRTKAELMMRKRGEESALTGKPMKPRPEIKKDTVAKREFLYPLSGKTDIGPTKSV